MNAAHQAALQTLKEAYPGEVSRERLRAAVGQSEWARRVRELKDFGYDVELTATGRRLTALEPILDRAARSGIDQKTRYRIIRRDGSKCQRCGRGVGDGVRLVVDHRIPIDWLPSSIDPDTDDNLWTLCEECNQGKKSHFADVDPEVMRELFGIDESEDRIKAFLRAMGTEPVSLREVEFVSNAVRTSSPLDQIEFPADRLLQVFQHKGARDRLREYFKMRVGEVVSIEELRQVAQIQDYPRRIREIREEGWDIASQVEDPSLGNGQYILRKLHRR